ncbi:DUF262 domain-containing protein [Dyadobacter luticola]|uniref:DUF262 domain-containing protein n=1 Tax=Dyadobacter luticola TaxID=1979387 RepID=A0A5R9KVS4_9BACT|nr:DUF262 domain-containing protein [Dyadobacter luticola]TLV00344.1 DUF262 domain-containing protein [Dyadobacter luticola]
MNFVIESWTIRQLIDLYESGSLNLAPPYQRGDIWSANAKRKLIGSIKLSYPLPAFFFYRNDDNTFEIVDGQQRTRTILGYHNGFFADDGKETIETVDKSFFYQDYKIAVYVISNSSKSEIEDFYYRVNSSGIKLNRPEILKAQYSSTPQQILAEKLADHPDFESLQIFSETSLNRLNHTDLVTELLTLLLLGNTDKKIQVDKQFYGDEDFSESKSRELEERFLDILLHLQRFNSIYPIKKTRYKQRSDFYTLFGFLDNNRVLTGETLDHFYKILILIGPDIYPTNEKCYSFKEYADNCVSQSNSKKARDARSEFFAKLLENSDSVPLSKSEEDEDANLVIMDALNFYELTNDDLTEIEGYWPIKVSSLISSTGRTLF